MLRPSAALGLTRRRTCSARRYRWGRRSAACSDTRRSCRLLCSCRCWPGASPDRRRWRSGERSRKGSRDTSACSPSRWRSGPPRRAPLRSRRAGYRTPRLPLPAVPRRLPRASQAPRSRCSRPVFHPPGPAPACPPPKSPPLSLPAGQRASCHPERHPRRNGTPRACRPKAISMLDLASALPECRPKRAVRPPDHLPKKHGPGVAPVRLGASRHAVDRRHGAASRARVARQARDSRAGMPRSRVF
jgi:hypothetical protein